MAGEKGPVLLLALTFVFSGGGEFGFRTAFRTYASDQSVQFIRSPLLWFRAINCNRNDMVPSMSNSVQYFARKSCKFARFLTVKILVVIGLTTRSRSLAGCSWWVAGRISERIVDELRYVGQMRLRTRKTPTLPNPF